MVKMSRHDRLSATASGRSAASSRPPRRVRYVRRECQYNPDLCVSVRRRPRSGARAIEYFETSFAVGTTIDRRRMGGPVGCNHAAQRQFRARYADARFAVGLIGRTAKSSTTMERASLVRRLTIACIPFWYESHWAVACRLDRRRFGGERDRPWDRQRLRCPYATFGKPARSSLALGGHGRAAASQPRSRKGIPDVR
jgi:hypothetical protein